MYICMCVCVLYSAKHLVAPSPSRYLLHETSNETPPLPSLTRPCPARRLYNATHRFPTHALAPLLSGSTTLRKPQCATRGRASSSAASRCATSPRTSSTPSSRRQREPNKRPQG